MNKRRNIMVLMISLSLVLLLGSSYALLRSTEVGSNPYVINVGTLQVTFDSGKTEKLSLENMYPMRDKEGMSQSDELGFTVKNTGTVASYYDVTLEETSTNPEFKSVIRYIINKDDKGYNEPKTLGEDKFIEVGGYLKPDESSSYKVKVWLDYNADNTYMNKEFKAKVVVNSFQESNYAKDVIKSKLVKYEESSKEDFNGGLVAVNTDGDLYKETDSSQEIREYRYSGLNVNNYVTFNDELWRIVGVFKDEVGEERLKIVRNETLSGIFPETYIINDETYKIERADAVNQLYWNSLTKNDWATAGLQYWLNTKQDETPNIANKGYLSYLKDDSEEMIEKMKYYLGTVTVEEKEVLPYNIIDTPKQAYKNERAISGCPDEKGPSENTGNFLKFENTPTCKVWANNSSIWEGKVALLYASDIGYSISNVNENWEKQFKEINDNIKSLSWMGESWLLSPASSSLNGMILYNNINLQGFGGGGWFLVRPTLYLKSNVKIIDGTGEENTPYILSLSD